jgi:hypothetical protein
MSFKHPLDSVFNIEGGSDLDIENEYAMTDAPRPTAPMNPADMPPDIKDEDDILVEKRIDEVYDAAMEAFQTQTSFIEVIEPKFAARNAEVAAGFLNIALAAANSRAKVKVDRKRANQSFVPYANQGGKNTTNVVIASREEILKMITIDGENKKV